LLFDLSVESSKSKACEPCLSKSSFKSSGVSYLITGVLMMCVQQVLPLQSWCYHKQIQISPAVIAGAVLPMHARGVRSLDHIHSSHTSKGAGRKPRVVQVQCNVHPAGAASTPGWAQSLLSATLSASLLLSPVMMPPATTATGMEGNMLQMKAPEGTAAAE
jgi:hypothetical protein